MKMLHWELDIFLALLKEFLNYQFVTLSTRRYFSMISHVY